MKIDRAVIEINGGCNYSCQMCPQTTGRGKDWLKKMPLKQFENYVSQCADAGLRVVNLEGSGEPTLNNNLHEYIKIVKKYNAKAFCFSNGFKMSGDFMKKCVDSGLDFYRFSIIGYNHIKYKKWMNSDNFQIVLNNVKEMQKYVKEKNYDCVVATYHLILDNKFIDQELKMYKNIVKWAGVKTEIWKMHNWSGVYDVEYQRKGKIKTCGRPFSPDVVIRAGGMSGNTGAVAPCCQVLGRDSEAILGYMSQESLENIWYGEKYESLRESHRTGNYPDYCKSCDFLIDDPEVLVYTNYERELYKMHGTEFNLNDYRYLN